MKPFVRRSHLLVSVIDREAVQSSWTHNADAVILQLPSSPAGPVARQALSAAIETAGMGGAEVFVLVDRQLAYADIDAAVVPGLKGVVYPGAESAAEIQGIDTQLTGP